MTTYTESAICDKFKEFFKSFKVDGIHKYWELINEIIVNDDPVEFDFNEFPDEIKKIFSLYTQKTIHETLYRAISEILQIEIGSSVSGMRNENRIKFKILNHKRYSGIFEKPDELTEPPRVEFNKENDEKIPATVRIFNIAKSLIEKQIKSENDTEQIVIKVSLDKIPHWIDVFSPTFEQMIRVKTQNIYDEIYSDNTYKSGIKNIHAYALLNGSMSKPIFSRSAFTDGCLYYDLQNKNGTIYKISIDGITKAENDDSTPIFLKSPSAKTKHSMQLEPSFDDESALDEFVKLCRIKEYDRVVFVSHFISLFLKGFPIPIKVLHGEQGSAKTTVSGMIKSLVDPEGENALSLPEKIDDLAVVLSKRDISNFDNTDNFTKEISQFLCRAVTGTQYPKRKHYTNGDEFSLTLMSKIILNGIDPSINQPDLLERSIFYELPKIDKTARITDDDIKKRIDSLRPSVLGMIFNTIQKAMMIRDEVESELKGSSLPRMATFAIWGESISRVLGNEDNSFINRYWEMIDDSNLSLNEEYPLIPLVLDKMRRNCKLDTKNKKAIQMPLTVSLGELFTDLIGNDAKDKRLPIDSKMLGKQLKTLTPIIRTLGYEVAVDRYNKRDGKFTRGSNIIHIVPIEEKGLDIFG